MMTNAQCQAYAVIALKHLLDGTNAKIINTVSGKEISLYKMLDGIDKRLYSLFDSISEEEAESKVIRIFEKLEN